MANKTNTIKKEKVAANKKALLEALEKSLGIVTTACKAVNISRWSFYEYCKNDKDFKAKVDEISDVALDHAESQLHQRINKGSDAAIIFYLKTKGKDRGYVEKIEHANTHQFVDSIKVEVVKGTKDKGE